MSLYSISSVLFFILLLQQKTPSNFVTPIEIQELGSEYGQKKKTCSSTDYVAAYTTPSTVKEVSATLVATMKRRQFGGAGANTLTYVRRVQDQKHCRA